MCAGKQADPGTAGHQTSAPGSSPTKKAAACQINVSAAFVMGVTSVIVGLLHWSL